jgi:hypothetical protein
MPIAHERVYHVSGTTSRPSSCARSREASVTRRRAACGTGWEAAERQRGRQVTFSEEHQAWDAGDGRWYKAVRSDGRWPVQWYDGPPVDDSIGNLAGRDFDLVDATWQEADEAAGRTASNWYESASEGCRTAPL